MDGKPRIVSVVSAKAKDQSDGSSVSLATSLEGPLQELRVMLASGAGLTSGLVRQTAGDRKETGAKFIKP